MHRKYPFLVLRILMPMLLVTCSLRATLGSNELRDSLLHCWDNFPFQNTFEHWYQDSLAHRFDRFAKKLPLLSDNDRLRAVSRMLDKASANKQAYHLVAKLSGTYFYGEAMFVGQDEVYEEVLKHLISSGQLSDTEKIRPKFRLDLLKKNAVGQVASDFSFTLRDGHKTSLYKIPEDIRIVIFFDPSCIRCQALVNRLRHHATLNRAIQTQKLQVLAICISEDIPAWERIKHDLPQNWIVGLGSNDIQEKLLYDLHDFPAIYVLSGNRKVIYKNLPVESCLKLIEKLALQK